MRSWSGCAAIPGRPPPTAFANFPGEALYTAPPRSWAERAYNIVRWTEQPLGGHFAAMEQPELFVEDVRAWAGGMRGLVDPCLQSTLNAKWF